MNPHMPEKLVVISLTVFLDDIEGDTCSREDVIHAFVFPEVSLIVLVLVGRLGYVEPEQRRTC